MILLLLCSVMLRYAMRCDGMLFVSCHPLSAPVFDGIAGIDVLAEGDAASSCSVEGLGEELEALGGGEGGGRDCSTEKEEEEQEEEEEKDHDSNKSNKSTESGDTQQQQEQQQQQEGGQKVAPGGGHGSWRKEVQHIQLQESGYQNKYIWVQQQQQQCCLECESQTLA